MEQSTVCVSPVICCADRNTLFTQVVGRCQQRRLLYEKNQDILTEHQKWFHELTPCDILEFVVASACVV